MKVVAKRFWQGLKQKLQKSFSMDFSQTFSDSTIITFLYKLKQKHAVLE